MKRLIATAAATALTLTACGASGPSAAEVAANDAEAAAILELDEVRSDLEGAKSELEGALGDLEVDLSDAEEKLAGALEERDTARDEGDALQAALDTTTESLTAAEGERDAALADAAAVRTQYDPEIRAAAQGAWDAEFVRACGEASSVEQLEASVDGIVQFDNATMGLIGTENDLVDAVGACAEPARSASVEEREAARLASFIPPNVDQIVKDPASVDGIGFVLYANITQFDAATGKCTFHANFLAEHSSRSYNYDERAEFNAKNSSDCPELDGVDGDDFVKVWVTGGGVRTYSTSIGGQNTIPTFTIEKVEVVEKA